MKKSFVAIGFCFLMFTFSLSGCLSGEDGSQGEQGPPGVAGIDGEDGSSLHIVSSPDELSNCTSNIENQIFFVTNESAFFVCILPDWQIIDLTGPAGENGTDGLDGQDGEPGDDGVDGIDGQTGQTGQSVTAITLPEPHGDNCPNGGLRLIVGVDQNSDGALAEEEISQISFVCNGMNGDGNGELVETPISMLTIVQSPDEDRQCTGGGRVILQGLDNGDGSGIERNGILESGEIDYQTILCSVAIVELELDTIVGNQSSSPAAYGTLNLVIDSVIYFCGYTEDYGFELWAYDTVNETSWMISDINPGVNSSYPGYYMQLVHQDVIYFDAQDAVVGRELFAYSLLNHSTWLVADLEPGAPGSGPGEDMAISYGDAIFFTAIVTPYWTEMWGYNPVNGSLWLVADIMPVSSANPGWLMHHVHDGVLYFTARDLGNVHDLWGYNQYNGTVWKIINIGPNPWTHPGLEMSHVVGDCIYFDADDTAMGRELWAYNTSNGTTWLVADISQNGASDPGKHLSLVVDDTIYFDTNLQEIWAHTTTNHSTWKVVSHSLSSVGENFTEFTNNQVIFFTADDGIHGIELWSYDLKSGDLSMVSDIADGQSSSLPGYYMSELHGNMLILDATTPEHGTELYSLDTQSGIFYLLMDINSDIIENTTQGASSGPGFRFNFVIDGEMYFDAYDPDYGREIWKLWIEHEIVYN